MFWTKNKDDKLNLLIHQQIAPFPEPTRQECDFAVEVKNKLGYTGLISENRTKQLLRFFVEKDICPFNQQSVEKYKEACPSWSEWLDGIGHNHWFKSIPIQHYIHPIPISFLQLVLDIQTFCLQRQLYPTFQVESLGGNHLLVCVFENTKYYLEAWNDENTVF